MTDPITHVSSALKDRYRIEREIGEGGMATVYLAQDLKHDRKVAVKVLKSELAAVVGADRFLAEIKTTANLQHPHILPLFASGEADGFLYYVMPYVEGESLRERLDREGELPVEEAVRIGTAVAGALDYAHRQGVIHRDIKPANILLHDGQPLVADFGIALAVRTAGRGRLTETGLSLGTPYYMSPEQATGERDPDARSDVYALGCVLYEMLVGEPPYTGSGAQAVLGKILTSEPTRLTDHRRTIPEHVEAAVLKALEKRPADRFGSAAELVGGLGDAGFRIPPGPDGARFGVNPKWKSAAVASAFAALLLAVVSIGRLVQGGMGTAPPQYLPLALRDPPRAFFAWNSSVELAPEGNRIAYIGHERWWWSLSLDSGGSRSTPLGVQGNSVAFSPSGDSLAHTTSAWLQQLYVVDLATGGRTLLADSVGGHISWGADGWIYYTHSDLRRVRVSDGTRELLASPGPGEAWSARNPSPVPGGSGVLYTRVPNSPRTPADAEVFALDLRTGESSLLARGIEAVATSSGHILIAQFDGGLLAARFSADDLEIRGRPVSVLESLEVREVSGTGGSFSVTEDGSFLFVEARPPSEDTVVMVGRDGMVRSVVPGWGGVFYNPSALAYDETADRWTGALHRGLTTSHVYLREGGLTEPRPLTFEGALNVYPRFIPGSSDLGFVSTRDGRNWDLYRVPSNASGSEVLILDRLGDIREPRFSADGRWVVFCETSLRGERDVVAHRLAPDTLTELLAATEAEECFPDISPDGKWLAYTSDESGTTEVWVRPFHGNPDTRWKVSVDGGSYPRWSKSGRELFFVDPANEVVAVPILNGEVFRYGAPEVLFSVGKRSSWTGDTRAQDQEFILIRTRLEAPGQVVLIRNFYEVLRGEYGIAMPSPITLLNSALEARYTIQREFGQGGMATVYLADDLKHERKVALKVLKPELAAVVGADRFLAEIKTTANLQHPHILPLFDSGEVDGFLFYVMPYVEGESLRERMDREGELPVEEAVRITMSVADALDYAHRHGVIHRDIKPANILLHDGQPVVADFGIALAVNAAGGGRLTETGLSLGTPYYMSPEQATGERDPDPRSDVYALGCVLYEMLVGEPPYTGSSAQAVLGKILTTDPVRPTEHRRAIPPHIEATVLKALEKRPADRFGSAAELSDALKNPVWVVAQGAGPGLGGKRTFPTLVGLSVGLFVGALAAWGALGGREAVDGASTYLPMSQPPGVELEYDFGLPLVAISPDGRRVVYAAKLEGVRQLYRQDLDSPNEAAPIPGTDGGSAPFFPQTAPPSVSSRPTRSRWCR